MGYWGRDFGDGPLRHWMALGVAVALLATLGPYGTFVSMPFATRLVFWGGASVMLALLVRLSMWAILRGLLPAGWPRFAKRAVAAASAAVPGAYLAAQLHVLLSAGDYAPAPFASLYAYTIVPTLLLTLLLGRREPVGPVPVVPSGTMAGMMAAASPPVDPLPIAAGFVARAVPRLTGGRLLAVEAEDHYLRIHTDRGSDLALMRLRDAVAELAGVPGLQVHRSFWVAETGVAQVVRRGPSWLVMLESGVAVPVSRNYSAELKAAGWPERYAGSLEISNGEISNG
jgi:DNA-binding LytR/AlgR family response regulator